VGRGGPLSGPEAPKGPTKWLNTLSVRTVETARDLTALAVSGIQVDIINLLNLFKTPLHRLRYVWMFRPALSSRGGSEHRGSNGY
jgi:hypothetical protein